MLSCETSIEEESRSNKANVAATVKRSGLRPTHHFKNTIHLWEFLLELLHSKKYKSLISWTDQDEWEFKLDNPEGVAKQWGLVKHRPGMNYDKLSRALRYYYQNGIIKKVPGKRLVYKFNVLPYEYQSLKGMDERARRRQLQGACARPCARPTVICSAGNIKTRQDEDQLQEKSEKIVVTKPDEVFDEDFKKKLGQSRIQFMPEYDLGHDDGNFLLKPTHFCCSRIIFPVGYINQQSLAM